ncbi:Kinase family protein [Melia azedarach]|uniref:Kinase family protein n=2 Tax=Melia azedarach TaxID=155640 RepID=A0ACC1WSP8_MELAZ|nr:Kinase family protein [Melia azedarach]KAJ4701420.1 Kinase family protein [Melia azedarach]
MGYLSCNAESAIATCDTYNWDLRKKKKARNKPIIKIREFSYHQLVTATNCFSAESFLGKGSHGSVYKAVLQDGKLIAAVKKTTFFNHTSINSTNCNTTTPAENEIEILSRVQNPRLVNLIGFCADSKQSKLLVVEYMPNGSLFDLLHSASRPPGWSRRVRFALQVAKAIQTLHSSNPPVIHRDIKSSNILIDHNYNARLSDFGLALRGNVEDVKIKCTPPAGTLGYLDPGYLAPGDLSTKSDVFSFGILLLEIISGRNAIDLNYSPPSVVDWAVPMIKHGEFARICDCRIGPSADPSVIRQLAVLAARCVRSSVEKRPEISEVVEYLKVVGKRVHSSRVWSKFQHRVRCAEKSQRVVEHKREVFDGSEQEVAKNSNSRVSRVGGRKSRRVSSVSGAEYGSNSAAVGVGDRVMRSKSIGSVNEIKLGPDQFALVKRRPGPGVAVKMPVMRLSKSRSMGMLQSPRLVRCNNKGYAFEFGNGRNSEYSRQRDVSKLLINLDDEKKMREKPIVSF